LCSECNHEFKSGALEKQIKETSSKPIRTRIKKTIVDWKMLEVGSRIKVLSGSGDHYLDKNGDKVYMQETGAYYVQRIDSDGIIVTGKSGHGYIYMGEPKASKISNMIQKEKHSLVLMSAKNEL
jgi:hypothetical protein